VASDVSAAVENNARWCDVVCRSHGLATRFVDDLWTAPAGAPRFYPAVVTLHAQASVADVVRHMPAGAAAVKDSFARLDLVPEGFRVLFDAHWMACDPARDASPSLAWSAVGGAEELAAWVTAAGLAGAIGAELLGRSDVRIVAGRHRERGPIAAGAIFNAGGHVVGVSNVFSEAGDRGAVWGDVPGVAEAVFPGRGLVGLARAAAVAAAVAAGFTPLAPLRVWLRDAR
jgi:hypothetical protein